MGPYIWSLGLIPGVLCLFPTFGHWVPRFEVIGVVTGQGGRGDMGAWGGLVWVITNQNKSRDLFCFAFYNDGKFLSPLKALKGLHPVNRACEV